MRSLILSIAALGALATLSSGAQAYTVSSSNTLPIHPTSPIPVVPPSTPPYLVNQTVSVSGIQRSPYDGTKYNDTGLFTSIQSTGSAVLDFSSKRKLTELSLIWGSPDGFNVVRIYAGLNGTGKLLATVKGNDPGIQAYNGAGAPISPTNPATGYSFVKIAGITTGFRSVVFTNNPSKNAFEISTVSAIPLPAAAPMFGMALALMGGYGVAKRRRAVAAAA